MKEPIDDMFCLSFRMTDMMFYGNAKHVTTSRTPVIKQGAYIQVPITKTKWSGCSATTL